MLDVHNRMKYNEIPDEEMKMKDEILRQIDEALGFFRLLEARKPHSDFSGLPRLDATECLTLMSDCVSRFAPPSSQFVTSLRGILDSFGPTSSMALPHIAGVLRALRVAYEKGLLQTVSELVHADMFTDFVQMAEYLVAEGYKDAGAVIIGSLLEEHLRQLCIKNGLPIDSGGKPKKADQLNADLSSKSVYSKLDHKSITGWLDLRNKAAHGKYGDYTKEQVSILIAGIQDFMVRNPA